MSELPPGQAPNPADWQRLSVRLKRTLHGRIEEMFGLLDELASDLAAPPTRPALTPAHP